MLEHCSVNWLLKLKSELDYFCCSDFPSYLLLLKGAVDHARNKGIAVGPGRGTMPCSLVNFCLGLTGVNPLEYGLSFDMFPLKDKSAFPVYRFELGAGERYAMLEYMTGKLEKGCLVRTSRYSGTRLKTALEAAASVMKLPSSDKELLHDLIDGCHFQEKDAIEKNPILEYLMLDDAAVQDTF